MRYVALLRGINVGGNNAVSMAGLRKVFEDVGHTSVRSYINSGNVVFDAPRTRTIDLAKQLEDAVAREFAVRTRILVLSGDRVRRIAAGLPDDWERTEQWSCNVLYLFPEQASPRALTAFGADPEREEARYCDGAILHRVSRANVSRSVLFRLDKKFNDAVTIRTRPHRPQARHSDRRHRLSDRPTNQRGSVLRAGERARKIEFLLVRELASDGPDAAVACRVLKVSRSGLLRVARAADQGVGKVRLMGG